MLSALMYVLGWEAATAALYAYLPTQEVQGYVCDRRGAWLLCRVFSWAVLGDPVGMV
jgi:hypothetical protein